MDPSSFHPCIAKNLISMCRVLFVGILLLIILIVDSLSSYNIVGPSCGSPSSSKRIQRYFAALAAATAAMNSTSVELCAVTVCTTDLYTIAPPM